MRATEGGAGWWRGKAVQVTGPANSCVVCLSFGPLQFSNLFLGLKMERICIYLT